MKYRFYKIALKQKWYCIGQGFYSPHREYAAPFTEDDWQTWGEAEGLQREAAEDRGPKGEQVGLPGMGER